MISGKYNIYKNGELVASQENIITNFGKDAIWKYLTGSIPDWGGCIAIGAGGAASSANGLTVAAITDTKLDFEFSRNSTLIKSPQIIGGARTIILKTSLDPSIAGTISEMGVFNVTNGYSLKNYDQRVVTLFDEGVLSTNPFQWSAGTNSSTSRVGSANLSLTAGTNSTLGGATTSVPGYLSLDLTRNSPTDTIQLMVTPTAATGSITLRLYDDQTPPSYIETTWSQTFVASTTILTKQIKDFTFTAGSGSQPFNYNISGIYVASVNTAPSFDALRIDDTDSASTVYGLVSRAVLGTAVTKAIGDSVDIEYQLALTLG